MELHDYLKIARHYWRSIVATALLAVIATAGVTLIQSPTYSASASVYLVVQSGDSAGELSQGASYAERQVESFVRVAKTAAVLQPVIDELGLPTTVNGLAGQLSVSSPTGTSVIQVTVTDGDPKQAVQVADAVAASLITEIEDLAPTAENGQRLVEAQVIDPATIPQTPTSPRPLLNLALGVVIGLLVGAGQAVVRNLLDTRIRTAEDLAELTDAPLLGTISHINTEHEDAWAAAESYRQLRTNVGFLGLAGERRPSLVITSSDSNEGKTETACNLSRMIARAGEKVLLIDADLRRPSVASRLGIDGELGLTDVIAGRAQLGDALNQLEDTGLHVLPAGTIPPNPSELLASDALERLLTWAEKTYDYVVFDAPPLLPVTDAVVLGARTGGVILVARHGVVKRPGLETSLASLDAGSAPLLGLVLNDVPRTSKGSGGYYYYAQARPQATTADTDAPRRRKVTTLAETEH